eukprot:GEMP01034674.1.p1 GENE.GEMP01034674.1~~GEMP01034674.1.p1  ORF type:complete len:416 (+),score=77.59 GEMP01034674.1:139-1386(+)
MLRPKENQAAQGHRTRDKLCLITENLPYEPSFIKGKNTLYGTSLTSPTSTQCSDANTFLHDDAIMDDASETMTPGTIMPNLPNKRYMGADDVRVSPIGGGPTPVQQRSAHNMNGMWFDATVNEIEQMEQEDRRIASQFDPSAVEFIPNGNNRLFFEEGACGPYLRVEKDGLRFHPEKPPSSAYGRPCVIDTQLLSPKSINTTPPYMNKSGRVMLSPTSVNNPGFLLLSPNYSSTLAHHANGWGPPPVIAPLPRSQQKNHTVNMPLQGSMEESAGQKYYQDLRDRGQKVLERMHNMQVFGTPKAPSIEHPIDVKLNPEAPEFICTSPYGPVWPCAVQEVNAFPECLSGDFFNFLFDEDSSGKARGEVNASFKDVNPMNSGTSYNNGESSASSTPESSRQYIPLYRGLDDALFGTMW